MTIMSEPIAPTLEAIARGLDQTSEQLQTTRDRLNDHMHATGLYYTGMDKQFDGLRDTIRSQHLLVSADIAAARRDIATMDEHVGLLTTMATANANRLDGHDKRFDAIDVRFDGIEMRLDAHDTRFDRLDARLDGIDARVEALTDTFLQFRDGVDKRFKDVDKRFEGVDRRFDDIDKRFEGVDKRFDDIDKRFEGVDKRFDDIDKRFEGVDKRFDDIDKRFEGVDKRFDDIDERLGTLTDVVVQIRDAVLPGEG